MKVMTHQKFEHSVTFTSVFGEVLLEMSGIGVFGDLSEELLSATSDTVAQEVVFSTLRRGGQCQS